MQKRDEISLFNTIAILAVVLVHTIFGVELEFKSEAAQIVYGLSEGIFHFLFEGFIFLSGLRLFFNRYDKMSFDTFFVNRLVLILLPFTVFSILYYFCTYLSGEIPLEIGAFFLFFIKGDMAPDMYFIWVLMQFYLIMPIIVKLLKCGHHNITISITAVISIAVTAVSDMYPVLSRFFPQYLLFFIGGALAGIYYKEFKTFVREKKFVVTVLFILSLLVYGTALCFADGIILKILRLVYAASAIMLLFMISTALSDKYYIKSFVIRQVDKSAYFIFLIHGLIIYMTDIVLNDKLGMAETIGRYGLRALIVFVSTIAISILWRYISNVFLLKRII